MNSYEQHTPLSNALMTALFGGLVSTILSLFYNIFFRLATDFPLSEIINVSSIIFLINLIFLIIGLIYYFISRSSARGNTVYLVFMIVLLVIVLWLTHGIQRSDNPQYAHGFRGLLTGIIVIMGINALLIPYLINKKWFADFFL
jgi:hypothetical protein